MGCVAGCCRPALRAETIEQYITLVTSAPPPITVAELGEPSTVVIPRFEEVTDSDDEEETNPNANSHFAARK
jgi:hypothetical protein